MDTQKQTQRRTVQWSQQQKLLKQVQANYSLTKHSNQIYNQDSEQSDEDNIKYQKKSKRTIQIEDNIQKAKINRQSLISKPIDLKLINQRLSMKENTFKHNKMFDKCQDQDQTHKDSDFQKKRKMLCNQSYALKKNL